MDEDIKYWLELAQYDLGTAEAMLNSARYVYVLFMCQQSLEKLLKGIITKITNKLPPRLHNLLRLLELTCLEASEPDKIFLEKLSYYYLEARYPETKRKIAAEINRIIAENYLSKTKELFAWLENKIT